MTNRTTELPSSGLQGTYGTVYDGDVQEQQHCNDRKTILQDCRYIRYPYGSIAVGDVKEQQIFFTIKTYSLVKRFYFLNNCLNYLGESGVVDP